MSKKKDLETEIKVTEKKIARASTEIRHIEEKNTELKQQIVSLKFKTEKSRVKNLKENFETMIRNRRDEHEKQILIIDKEIENLKFQSLQSLNEDKKKKYQRKTLRKGPNKRKVAKGKREIESQQKKVNIAEFAFLPGKSEIQNPK